MTADGVSIAVCAQGSGPPLVHLTPMSASGLSYDQLPSVLEHMYRCLSERRTFIRYDNRGGGLSDRDIGTVTLDSLVADLEAVVEALSLEKVDLFAVSSSGPVAIAYAARHPERVSHLILWCTSARGQDIASAPRQAIDSLLARDWRIYTETIASAAFGWSDAEDAQRLATIVRETTAPAQRAAFYAVIHQSDVSDLLPDLEVPALVLHARNYSLVDASAARRVAAQLPDAELVLFEGNGLFPPRKELPFVLETIDRFLGGDGRFETPPLGSPGEGAAAHEADLRTILFTDVEGSTALTERLGDSAARLVLRQHERITRKALESFGGSEVKALGDGFMASFASASRALECAVSMQQSFAAYNQLGHETIRVRIGVNAGEPIAEGDDLFGTSVNLAERIAAKAQGGQVFVSDVVRQLVAGKGFLFADRGEVLVRGFEDPVRIFELRWASDGAGGESSLRAAPAPLDAWRETYFSND